LTSALLVAGWCAGLVAIAIAWSGGSSFHIGSLTVRAHSALPAFIAATLAFGAACRRGLGPVRQSLVDIWIGLDRRAGILAGIAAVCATAIGLVWGTYVAGGSDSYCYLNQALMFSNGEVRQPEPLMARAPWPRAAETLSPTAHLPAPDGRSFAPACAPGYPMLLAVANRIGGRSAMFLVTPLLGGLAVWLTFVLGRAIADRVSAMSAAVLLACSPAFLYQITQPMTDVPAVALWCLALLTALGAAARPGRALVAGLATGVALLVRPNLVPLAFITGALALYRPDERLTIGAAIRSLAVFAAGSLPSLVVILALNHAMRGHALDSGYGSLTTLFTLDHVAGNLRRYPLWLLQTQTPFIALALGAPWLMRAGRSAAVPSVLLLFAAVVFACYLPYTVWDAWWFLRFVLPAVPPLLILSAAVGVAGLLRADAHWRTVMFAAGLSALVMFQLHTAARRAVFELRGLEARFRIAGEYLAAHLPANAIVLTEIESGSVRFYAGRPTLVWEKLDPDWLDRALDWLRSDGYHPYFLLETDEESSFRTRFGSTSGAGQLDWPPAAEIHRQVRLYDPADRARYREGQHIATDYFWDR